MPLPQILWFAMRDLRRRNARHPSYLELPERGFEVFTPMCERIRHGERKREPFMQDLLFVHALRHDLDLEVALTPTLQYRYARGARYREAMTVPEADMQRFMQTVALDPNPRYLLPQEVTPQMIGRRVRVADGPFKGWTGRLLFIRGSHKKRLFVEIPDIITAGVTVENEYLEFL